MGLVDEEILVAVVVADVVVLPADESMMHAVQRAAEPGPYLGLMQRAGILVGPRSFSTGTILYGAHAPGYKASIESYEDALFHVRRLKEVGAISVKSYQQPRREQRQQVIAAGRELGLMVVPEGGAKLQHNLNEIVDGHTGIEHSISIARGYEDVK